ncbi:MAG: hypothetical protein H7A23_24395 [Leptospiraceae bacterium]|nr:hypothetical protein [Leptospiraceae bacterium]MCP5497706.1 hypothetical protein [Leptospiraceae bacterium]
MTLNRNFISIIIKKNIYFIFLVSLFLVNCGTTVGFHRDSVRESINFGSPKNLNVCLLVEDDIDLEDADELTGHWAEELELYNIRLNITHKRQVERFSFWGATVLERLKEYKVGGNCHRIVYLVGRSLGDIIFEFFAIAFYVTVGVKAEVNGAVEGQTNTRGYVKAKYVGLLQLLMTSPKSTLVHEGYHLLGCPHAFTMTECYDKIKQAKELSGDIFPVVTIGTKIPYTSSNTVNQQFGSTLNINE